MAECDSLGPIGKVSNSACSDLTLEMASNVTKNGRIAIYIQRSETDIFFILANLLFEEPCEIRRCC